MARALALVVSLLVAAHLGSAQTVNSTSDAPLVDYFSKLNSTTYSTFWLALEAGNLAEYLNNSALAITVFAPTNDAWLKRLPTLTTANGITTEQLFSMSKSAALQSLLQYSLLNTKMTAGAFVSGNYLSTLANLCSDAKTLQVIVNKGGSITLNAAGGTRPNLLDKGLTVGKSIVYAVDDLLLPSVVTIPLSVALSNYNGTDANPYSPIVAAESGTIDNLQQATEGEALAPVFQLPATPPATSTTPVSSGGDTTAAPVASPTTSATPTTTPAATPKATTKATPTPTATPSAGGVDPGTVTTTPSTGR